MPEPHPTFTPDELSLAEQAELRATIGDFGVRRVADVAPERVEFVWQGRMPRAKLTIEEGDPKIAKSTLSLDLAARISTGAPMPSETTRRRPESVILLSAEDGVATTIRPRLDAHGADLERVFVWDDVPTFDGDGRPTGFRTPSFPADTDALGQLIARYDAGLVIIDPLNAYLSADVDGHRDQDVRRALMPLAKLAEKSGAAILVVRHLNKSPGGPAIYRGGGSIGITAAARAVLLCAQDPDDDTGSRRVLAVTACNVAPPAPALSYELISTDERGCARIRWLGTSEHTSTTLLSAPRDEGERGALEDAVAFLKDELAVGWVAASDVAKDARSAGVASRTLDRAKAKLGVDSRKIGTTWKWHLPFEADQGRQPDDLGALEDRQPQHPGDVGVLGALDADQEIRSIQGRHAVGEVDGEGQGRQGRQVRHGTELADLDGSSTPVQATFPGAEEVA